MPDSDSPISRDVILRAVNASRVVNSEGKSKAIISEFTFDFCRGGIYNILGPSGAGKSSLLRLFNRLDETTGGRILFDGRNIKEFIPCSLRREIGYLFQTPYLFPRTVRDNLLFVDSSLSQEAMATMLSEVNLGQDYLNRNVEVLSLGEKQRIALARLFAMKPQILLLDEPTSALDEKNAALVLRLIKRKLSGNGITAITVTHNPRQASVFDGEGLLIMEGKLVEYGPVKELITGPATEEGKTFLEGGTE